MAATIICPNPECQAPNQVSQSICAHCRFPIPKVYLWALGEDAHQLKVGQVINNRYLVVNKRVLLDTKPSLRPDHSEKLTDDIARYLRLLPYKLHVPQIYGSVNFNRTGRRATSLWLLENPPVHSSNLAASLSGQLMPDLETAWKTAGSMRQLNWLWQMAQLWQPLSEEGCVSTLFDPQLVRVDQGVLKLLELATDKAPLGLVTLGEFWQKLLKTARLGVAQPLEKISQGLVKGDIATPEKLLSQLDQALAIGSQRQFLECEYVTLSHTGPSRNQNEDACYPVSGTAPQYRTGYDLSLAIVCDGVGGHHGGEVASNLAIETIRNRLENVLTKPENRNPESTTSQISTSVCVANDQISLRNDSENRFERQRMGTTVALAIVQGHEAYVANVGDSRVYRITRSGCQQVTLDDDLATREVRLGYSIYRDALTLPSSGSLFQALGMNSSSTLHPNVHRLVVDEECVFLLCSDGLSDNNRVEQFWQSDILPLLEGKIDLTTAANRLVNTANTRNGHDNSSVALLHCRVKQPRETITPAEATATLPGINLAPTDTLLLAGPEVAGSGKKRQPVSLVAIGGVIALGVVATLVAVWYGSIPPTPSPTTSPPPPQSPPSAPPP